MLAVYRKELKCLFSCRFGYVFTALLCFLTGLCVAICNLLASSADLAFALFPMQWGVALAIPFLCARAFGKERERGTDLLLASLPLSHTAIVLGKYLAQVTVLAIPTALAALLSLLLAALGSASLAAAFTALLGYFLFVCALEAICLFAASFAKTALHSFLLALAAALVLRGLDLLAALLPPASAVAAVLRSLSPFARFEGFSYGYFDLSALVYFITVIALFLLLTLQFTKPLASRRAAALLAALSLLATVGCNALVGLVPYNTANPSVTGSNTFTLSGVSRDALRSLDEDVTLYLIREDGRKTGELYGFLLRYAEENPRIRVDVLDVDEATAHLSARGVSDLPSDSSVIVESARRCRVVDYTELFYYYCYDSYYGYGITLSPAEYQAELEALAEGSAADLSTFIHATTPYFDGDAQVTNAIRYVTLADPLTLCILTKSVGASTLDTELKQLLSDACCEVKTVLSVVDLPQDCDVLLIHAPTSDLSASEAEALSSYLANGGKILLTTFYQYLELPRLRAILSSYGMDVTNDKTFVVEGDTGHIFSGSADAYPELFYAHIDSTHAATADFDGSFLLYLAHAIETAETEGVTLHQWLYSSDSGYLCTYNEATKGMEIGKEEAARALGVIAERENSAILWISTPYALTSTYNAYAEGGNFELFLSALAYLGDADTARLSISARAVDTALLSFSDVTQPIAWSAAVILVPSLALLTSGLLLCSLRRKRR